MEIMYLIKDTDDTFTNWMDLATYSQEHEINELTVVVINLETNKEDSILNTMFEAYQDEKNEFYEFLNKSK